jgi:GH25 family lysozyme M1 (1,4-beta-N-acetylmuramidase)
MTFSKHTNYTAISNKHRGGRSGQSIQYFTVHHCASTSNGNVEYLAYSAVEVSANYVLRNDNQLVGLIPEELAAWTTGPVVDNKSITVETVNTTGAPNWNVSAAQKETLAIMFLDFSERYGWGRPTRARIQGHQEWGISTACPGPDLLGSLQAIANRAAQLWDAKRVPPKPRPVWTPLTGGSRKLKLIQASDVTDIYTGGKQGATLAAETILDIHSETTYAGKRWFRSNYSASKGFDWGIDASRFVEAVPPKPRPVWTPLTGGARNMVLTASTDIVDVYTGAKQGNTIASGASIEASTETTFEGKRWVRTTYSTSKGFDWGIDAAKLSDTAPPKPSYYKPVLKGMLNGVDVSRWNTGIDFNAYSKHENFAIVRLSYILESGSGKQPYTDPAWEDNLNRIRNAGLKTGHYVFNSTQGGVTPKTLAEFTVTKLKNVIKPGELVILDVEGKKTTYGTQKQYTASQAKEWAEIVAVGLNCKPLIYMSRNEVTPAWDVVWAIGVGLWVADWQGNTGTYKPTAYIGEYAIHQYTSKSAGDIPGIPLTSIDRNIAKDTVFVEFGHKTPSRVEKKNETVNEPILNAKITELDETRPKDYKHVSQAGFPGNKRTTFEVTYTDGIETGRKTLSVIITEHPVTEITIVGAILYSEESRTENVPYETKLIEDSESLKGTQTTVQTGKDGSRQVIYRVGTVGDKEVSKVELSASWLLEPVIEIIKVGTKRVQVIYPVAKQNWFAELLAKLFGN